MSGLWPGDTKCVVTLTFDMDGASGMLRREPSVAKRPSLMSQGDFGPETGTPRILEVLASFGVPSTWFIPGWVAERQPYAVEAVLKAGHEVGHHGYMHEPPSTLSSRQEEAELLDRGSEALEKVTGSKPKGYRSPGWDVSEHTLGLLADRGFVYDSSLMEDDVPYFVDVATARLVKSTARASPAPKSARGRPSPAGRGAKRPMANAEGGDEKRGPSPESSSGSGRAKAGVGRTLVEMPVHWALDDTAYYPYNSALGRLGGLTSPQVALETWLWEFDAVHEHGGAFMLTMHPFVSGRWSRVVGLGQLIRQMKSRPGVEFMRCIDVANGWTEGGLRAAPTGRSK